MGTCNNFTIFLALKTDDDLNNIDQVWLFELNMRMCNPYIWYNTIFVREYVDWQVLFEKEADNVFQSLFWF